MNSRELETMRSFLRNLFFVICVTVLLLSASAPSNGANSWRTINTKELKNKIDLKHDFYLINVLPKIIFDAKHIPGSINIPIGKIATSTAMLKDKNKQLIFYCMGVLWVYSTTAARVAVQMGYKNVMVYRQGLLKWEKSGFPINTVVKYPKVNIPLISSKELDGMSETSMFLLDIRPQNHFQKGHIEGAINIDLEDLQDDIQYLPRYKQIILIDHKGKLTLTTGRFLYSKGFRNLTRLDGGFNAWVNSGLPIQK